MTWNWVNRQYVSMLIRLETSCLISLVVQKIFLWYWSSFVNLVSQFDMGRRKAIHHFLFLFNFFFTIFFLSFIYQIRFDILNSHNIWEQWVTYCLHFLNNLNWIRTSILHTFKSICTLRIKKLEYLILSFILKSKKCSFNSLKWNELILISIVDWKLQR